jgi:hypothetical protein
MYTDEDSMQNATFDEMSLRYKYLLSIIKSSSWYDFDACSPWILRLSNT